MKKYLLLTAFMLFCSVSYVSAQRMAVKSNALGWLALSPNVGVDISLSPSMTLTAEGSFNLWDIPSYGFRHTRVSADTRYWFTRPFIGHNVGLGFSASSYNTDIFGYKCHRDQILLAAKYGYTYILSKHWNIEGLVSVGVGDINEVKSRGSLEDNRFGFAIDQVAISFVYIIR